MGTATRGWMVRLGLRIVLGGLCLGLSVSADGQEAAKKPSDAEIAQMLVGRWSLQTDVKVDTTVSKVKTQFHYKKDGSFEAKLTGAAGGVTRTDAFAGKWKVADGTIEVTLTKVNAPSNPRLKVGDKSKERVIAINDTTLTTQELNIADGKPLGEQMTMKRVKE